MSKRAIELLRERIIKLQPFIEHSEQDIRDYESNLQDVRTKLQEMKTEVAELRAEIAALHGTKSDVPAPKESKK
jgi:prefoldin subunit 5